MSCPICRQEIPRSANGRGIAHYDCGHVFHLRCALNHAYQFRTSCPSCTTVDDMMPHLGGDRSIAIASTAAAARRRRILYPSAPQSAMNRLWGAVTGGGSQQMSLKTHIHRGTNVEDLKKFGFVPDDLVAEQISWNTLISKYKPTDILNFGVTWNHAMKLGVRPAGLKVFTWAQLRHVLCVSAHDLLRIDTNINDLAELGISPVHLLDMGFDWAAMESMGASVETLKALNISINDIKTYWKPTVSQFERCGFYDKQRLLKSGWDVERVSRVLPNAGWRTNGRVKRSSLAF